VSFGLIMIGTLMLTCLRTPGAGSAFGIRLRPVHREDQLAELSARCRSPVLEGRRVNRKG